MNNKLPDYYKILGVARLADDKEIERAFRQKAMQCHPDRFFDPKEKIQKTKEFQTINEAYTLLSKYSERKKHDADLERQEAEEQDRWERERQEKEARERRERGNQAQNQGLSSEIEFNGFLFETIKYRYESASIGEIKRGNAFTPPEDVARIKRVLKPFGEGGSFFDATSPIGGVSMTVRLTGKELNGEFLFTKNGAYNYSWKGTFQMRGYKGSATRFMIRDFKELVNSSYNTAMDWATEIVQNGHPAPAEPEDDEWDEDEPESYDEVAPEEDSYGDEGDIENEKLDPVVEAAAGIWNIGYYTVPALLISLGSFCLGDPIFGGIFLLIAILVGGVLFLVLKSAGTFDYFKKTKPKPTPAKPKPATAKPNPTPAKPQPAKKSPVEEDPDSEGRLVLVFIGLVMLLMFVIFIQII